MYTVYELQNPATFVPLANHGHESRDEAIVQALELARARVVAKRKDGKLATVRPTLAHEGKLAFVIETSKERMGGYAVDAA